MNRNILKYGFIFVTASLLFYPLVEFTVKDTIQAIAFARYGNFNALFVGYTGEIMLAMMLGFIIALGITVLFGLSVAFNTWRREEENV